MRLNIVFPIKGPGGVQTLYINLIKHCVSRGIKVRLFDIENGYLSSSLIIECGNAQIECKLGVDEWKKSEIDSNDRFVVTNYSLPSLYKYFSGAGVRFLYYDVFAPSLKDFYLSWPIKYVAKRMLKKSAQRLIEEMNNKNSLATMDTNGVEVLKNEFDVLCEKIIPVPIGIEKTREKIYSKSKKRLCIGMISRAVDWKLGAYRSFIENLDDKTFEKFDFLVITDDVSKASNLIGSRAKSWNFEIRDKVANQQLENILVDDIDIYIGMGTTILDAASLGIASFILTVGKYNPLKSEGLYDFVNAKHGDLGSSSSSCEESSIYKIIELKNDLIIDELIANGKRSSEKAVEVHGKYNVLERLLECIWSAQMQSSQLGFYNFIRFKLYESKLVWFVKKIFNRKQYPFYNF